MTKKKSGAVDEALALMIADAHLPVSLHPASRSHQRVLARLGITSTQMRHAIDQLVDERRVLLLPLDGRLWAFENASTVAAMPAGGAS